MIKSSYQEGLYHLDGFDLSTGSTEDEIRLLLSQNHGVGILGGYYDRRLPRCMVSELTMQMLGYGSAEEFEKATGNCMAGLISGGWSEEEFSALDGACEMYLRGRGKDLRVRLVKHNAAPVSGRQLWLASVCDMDALYQKELQVTRITQEKRQQELAQQAKLEKANRKLERQKVALERALSAAELNNEVISAIGKIYWLIYRLDLVKGTFEEISVNESTHRPTGNRGRIVRHFPDACQKTVAPDYQERMLAFLDVSTLSERLRGREEISLEYQTATGNWHLGRFIVQKRGADGNVTAALYAIQIINEQKRQELEYEQRLANTAEEAQRANLSKTDFLRRMSHDIRTPINGIRGMIEIANHCPDDLKKQAECRLKIWEASGYLLSLISSVLDMNKLESGVVVLSDTSFDLRQLLDEVNTIAEMQAIEHGLHYAVDLEEQQLMHTALIGSPRHLKQVLMNLAGNAVKYNKENGSIRVWCKELSCDNDTAVFRFACIDTGIGMSPEFQAHAFEPFSQEGRNNARTRYDGSGLGLSIVKGLVEQMGGSIDFTSEEGVGTTFYVTLTFKLDSAPLPAAEPEDNEETADLSGVRILLAEDNDLNMEIALFFLERYGAQVLCARNGQEATELFSASSPGDIDLILMDVMMPVMNGYDATRTIRAMDRPDAAGIPIIAMSANAFQDDILKSRAAGMNEHLPKPLSTQKLLSTVRRYTKHRN